MKIFSKKMLFSVLIGIACGFFLKFFVVDIFRIRGISMEPTLKNDSFVLVSKLSYGISLPFSDKLLCCWHFPAENDIIIYLYNNNIVVKRCVATAGKPLEYSIKNGYTLWVGAASYPLTEEQYHRMYQSSCVPEGTVLAIGDNAEHSIDSRNYGFVPVKNILGKVLWK